MKLPIAIMAVTYIAIVGSAFLFKALDVSPEVRVAIWGFIIMVGGGATGALGDRFPEPADWLRRRRSRRLTHR
jgi:hypothetical protein